MFVTLPLAIFAELTHTSQRHGCHIASSIVMMFMGVLQHCGVVASFVLLPPSDFRPMFIELLFDFRPTSIELPSTNYHPQTLSIDVRPSLFIFDTIFFKPYQMLYIATKFWGMGQHDVLG